MIKPFRLSERVVKPGMGEIYVDPNKLESKFNELIEAVNEINAWPKSNHWWTPSYHEFNKKFNEIVDSMPEKPPCEHDTTRASGWSIDYRPSKFGDFKTPIIIVDSVDNKYCPECGELLK